jgi:antirestriction protein ArdC
MANSSFRSARSDVYTRITDDIVAAIEQGAGEWQMPWHHDGSGIARPRNVASDKAYRGINVLALWVAAHRAGYTSGIWGTYRQWAERGCQVRRGETATTVVFWKQIGRRDDGEASHVPGPDDDDERSRRPHFLARGYHVFNAAQVDGYVREELPCLPESERITRADAFFAALNIPTVMGGNEACYRPDIDTILMPPFEHFIDAASFYSCLYHETGHAVGHPSRLNRDLTGRYGLAKYAMDEAVN